MAHPVIRGYIVRKRIARLRSRLTFLDGLIEKQEAQEGASTLLLSERAALRWAVDVLADIYEPNPTRGD